MAATNSLLILAVVLVSSAASAREAATPEACRAAATHPPVGSAAEAVAARPDDLKRVFALADSWSEAGCFSDALQVLGAARAAHPNDHELLTRLRVAHSVVGEEQYFEYLDRADDQARIKRDLFRCNSLTDLTACADAARLQPDSVEALTAQADALTRAGRVGDAAPVYRRAITMAPDKVELTAKLASVDQQIARNTPPAPEQYEQAPMQLHEQVARVASSQMPVTRGNPSTLVAKSPPAPRRYSNLEPETQSH